MQRSTIFFLLLFIQNIDVLVTMKGSGNNSDHRVFLSCSALWDDLGASSLHPIPTRASDF